MEGNDINLIATVFSVTEGKGLLSEYGCVPVIAHGALVLKRDF